MEILVDRDVEPVLVQLMRRYTRYEWAVAWASVGLDAGDLLRKNSSCIHRLVVGTHFHQTHPDFLKQFHATEGVRFVMSPSGVFHPKVYLFSDGTEAWEALVGSANFTRSAFEENQELVVRIGSADDPSGAALERLRSAIDTYWEAGRRLSAAEVEGYRAIWNSLASARDRLTGTYRSRTRRPDSGVSVLETRFGLLPWPAYFQAIRSDRFNSFSERLEVLRAARDWFREHRHFSEMAQEVRQRIAGTNYRAKGSSERPDWHYFGSMWGAGTFKGVVNENSPELSRALDAIPLQGDVERHHYDAFMEAFASAFVGKDRGADGIATATRLLAMKRPDHFVCIDSKNRDELCKAFGVSRNSMDRDAYWERIVARVRDCAWWKSEPSPGAGADERDAWQARAAFLDSIFYQGLGND